MRFLVILTGSVLTIAMLTVDTPVDNGVSEDVKLKSHEERTEQDEIVKGAYLNAINDLQISKSSVLHTVPEYHLKNSLVHFAFH